MAVEGKADGGILGAEVAAVPGTSSTTSQRVQALHSHYGLEPQGNGGGAEPAYGRRRGASNLLRLPVMQPSGAELFLLRWRMPGGVRNDEMDETHLAITISMFTRGRKWNGNDE